MAWKSSKKESKKSNCRKRLKPSPSKSTYLNYLRTHQSVHPLYNFRRLLQHGGEMYTNTNTALADTISSKVNLIEKDSQRRYPPPDPRKCSRLRLLSKENVSPMDYERKSLNATENIMRRRRIIRRVPLAKNDKRQQEKKKKCNDKDADTNEDEDENEDKDTDSDIDSDTDTDKEDHTDTSDDDDDNDDDDNDDDDE